MACPVDPKYRGIDLVWAGRYLRKRPKSSIKSSMRSYCRLCDALSGQSGSGEVRRCDTILYKTANFVLMPAIGPLSNGHAMIVSRKHFVSLADMSQDAVAEYDKLIKVLLALPAIGNDLLEAEHGGTTNEAGGACITHTHVNVFPGLSHLAGTFAGTLPKIPSILNIEGITRVREPYVMTRANAGATDVYLSLGTPSQFIRRVLSNELGLARWDWRTAPDYELIDKTASYWENAFAHAQIT